MARPALGSGLAPTLPFSKLFWLQNHAPMRLYRAACFQAEPFGSQVFAGQIGAPLAQPGKQRRALPAPSHRDPQAPLRWSRGAAIPALAHCLGWLAHEVPVLTPPGAGLCVTASSVTLGHLSM